MKPNKAFIKAEPARPFDSKPAWRGVYRNENGKYRWNYVTNNAGGIILYASEEAALAGAQWARSVAAARIQAARRNAKISECRNDDDPDAPLRETGGQIL